jgi:alkylation response protein AidB-like acyl-CoA dehydrogenase
MQQFHTEREQGFIDLATTLGDDFATRAAQHDEEGSFPYENYARLKETGYTILTVPEELGGMGASLLERIKTQERLAQGCGPTALAINMHFNVMGLLINLWHKRKTPIAESMLRKIVQERLIVGGSGSEPDNAISVLRPRTQAVRVDGGWRVSGRKIFSTQSIALDRYFAEATWKEGEHAGKQTGTVISFMIPHDTPGFIIKDDWNTMGMRSTESRSTELQDAFIPESNVFLERPVFTRGGVTDLFPRAPFTIGSVYIGIAIAARDFVVEFMRDRPRFPLKKPMSHLPSVYNKVGEMDALIETARAVMWKAAAEADQEPPRRWIRKSVAARMVAMENSVEVVDLAMRTVGGIAYFKRLPLERYYRDVRAGLFHPFDTDETLELLGKTAFGIPMYDEDTIRTAKEV